jgi:hypothetical protein
VIDLGIYTITHESLFDIIAFRCGCNALWVRDELYPNVLGGCPKWHDFKYNRVYGDYYAKRGSVPEPVSS